MDEIRLSIPVYFTQEYKTKKDKAFLVGMNWYRNAHYISSNNVKKHFSDIISNQLKDIGTTFKEYSVEYTYFYKTATTDLLNIGSLSSKFLNDSLQELGIVSNDNVLNCLAERFYVGGKDSNNPRMDIVITRLV